MKNASFRIKAGIILILFVLGGTVLGAAPSFWVDFESGAAFTGYNDVEIPNREATRFSLSSDLDPDPVWYYRLRLGADFDRHSLSLLYAPLRVVSRGDAPREISFADETFPAGSPLEGVYVFNSYRLTWSYALVDTEALRLAAGVTGKIREASISLKTAGLMSESTNLGVVPLIHLDFLWRFAPAWAFQVSGDGLAVPQGRAEDFQAALVYTPGDDVDLRLGYRILEGGSDASSVYTFALFHYITAGIKYRF
jgi:hypothetical protein